MPSLLLEIITLLVTGGALYGAIRSDLRNIHERLNKQEAENTRAHARIDSLIQRG